MARVSAFLQFGAMFCLDARHLLAQEARGLSPSGGADRD